jgi:hypothetical protein
MANPVAANSFAIHWESDGFTIEIPYSVGVVFKAGYVYKWIITGDSQYNNLLSADNPIYTIISNEEYDNAINEKTLYRE